MNGQTIVNVAFLITVGSVIITAVIVHGMNTRDERRAKTVTADLAERKRELAALNTRLDRIDERLTRFDRP